MRAEGIVVVMQPLTILMLLPLPAGCSNNKKGPV
jgi:hypothetical protein